MSDKSRPVILFDGFCNLCNSSVQFILNHERAAEVDFASLSSTTGQAIIREAGGELREIPDSIVVVWNGELLFKSSAALFVAGYLRSPWRLLKFFRFVPVRLRDMIYDFIAANRYRWFGRRKTCMVPTPKYAQRFLDSEDNVPSIA